MAGENSGSQNALYIQGLITGYGNRTVVDSVDLRVAKTEIVALVGHNGAGKTTLLKAIFGILPIWEGEIRLYDNSVRKPSPRLMRGLGVGYLPQGGGVFDELTVRENLEVGGHLLGKAHIIGRRIDEVVDLFPGVKAQLGRRAGILSGGEKQLVALASALMLSPAVLLLDEPSLGLAFPLVESTFERLGQLSRELGVSILVAEQKVRQIFAIADHAYVLRNGKVVLEGSADLISASPEFKAAYL